MLESKAGTSASERMSCQAVSIHRTADRGSSLFGRTLTEGMLAITKSAYAYTVQKNEWADNVREVSNGELHTFVIADYVARNDTASARHCTEEPDSRTRGAPLTNKRAKGALNAMEGSGWRRRSSEKGRNHAIVLGRRQARLCGGRCFRVISSFARDLSS